MYTTSEFAKLCHTSKKTIHYYHQLGLLPADYVSPENGYRYYKEETLDIYRQIQRMQEAGFTLNEIQNHLQGTDQLSDQEFYGQKIAFYKKKMELCEILRNEQIIEYIKLKRKYSRPYAEKICLQRNEMRSGDCSAD